MYDITASFDLPSGYYADGVIPSTTTNSLQNIIVLASKSSTDASPDTSLFYFQQSENTTTTDQNKYSFAQVSSGLDSLDIYQGSQPLALDVNGDQAMDLLYQSSSDGIKVAIGSRDDPLSFTSQDFFSQYVVTNAQNADCSDPNKSDLISFPNSNAFIDLNGDCLADIVLTRQTGTPEDLANGTKTVNTYYEVYSQVFVDGVSKYCLSGQNG